MDILNFLGRFHPLILHLPIGFLLLAFMMECYDRWRKTTQFQAAIGFALFWGMLGAIGAAGSGYLLSLEGGYEESLLSWHQWLGFGVAGLSIVLYGLHRQQVKNTSVIYFPVFSAMVVALSAAGHYGGSLTHGSDFLSPSATVKAPEKVIVDIDNAVIFDDLVQPILQKKCVQCHKESKTKGDLLMTTTEGLESGGKTGALFVKGDVDKSLMLQRAHLPMDDKKHMPPKGKQQLLKDELELLSWWIAEGADFKASVKEVQKDEKIEAILKKFITPADGLETVKVERVADNSLQKIRSAGIPIFRLAEKSPFVEVDLSNRQGVSKSTLKKLSPVADQLVSLNLGKTDIQNADLSYLTNFPHLEKLYLQQTEISDEGLETLPELTYLTYLNLYDTKVTDAALPTLSKIQRLQKLYLWQTATTQEGIAQYINDRPRTMVDAGVKASIFGDSKLQTPLIIAENDLFSDSMRVELKLNLKNTNIYYTLDGTTPDSTSLLYDGSFLLDRTANLQAVAMKDGWQPSKIVSRQLTKVKHKPVNIRLNKAPHERYAAQGSKSLADFQKGTLTFTDGNWLGYEKEHLVATLDLGKSVDVSAVSVGALEAPSSYIFFPKGLQVSLSNDGQKYETIVTKKYQTAPEDKPSELGVFRAAFDQQKARYIKVKVESNLVNPDWHPAPGAPCWLFVDEIAVE
ncbi:MAG: FN3 associated domain-containing protein [Bacteroidota bacterium]